MNNSIDSIMTQAKASPNTYVIGIAGGSCVGKSYYSKHIHRLLQRANVEEVCLTLDNYAKGEDFLEKNHSPYRWDDPKNFDLASAAEDLFYLKKGDRREVPVFDLKENKKVGKKEVLPKKIIIIDGLFLGYDNFRRNIDSLIYIESPFYSRFFRRLTRFHTQTMLQIPFKHMIKYIYDAHNTFIKPQTNVSDFTLMNIINIQSDVDQFLHSTSAKVSPTNNANMRKKLFMKDAVSFQIDETNRFFISNNDHELSFSYDIALKEKLLTIDWNIT